MSKIWTRQDVIDLILESTGLQSMTPMLTKQLNRLSLEAKMTYKEIARCLVYRIEVEKKPIDQYGIWFVPNIRELVDKYFAKLELDQQRRQEQAKRAVEYQDDNVLFNLKNIKVPKRQPKQIDISEIDVTEGDQDNEG